MLSLSEQTKDEAYTKLCSIIYKHKTLIARSEQSRLARERLFYKPNTIQYKRLVEKSRRVDADTNDNLIKMALHIVKESNLERLQLEYTKIDASGAVVDMEEGHIESRVSKNQALELLAAWKKILIDYKNEGGDVEALFDAGSGNSESLLGSEK